MFDPVIGISMDGDPETRDLLLAGCALVKKAYTEIETCSPENAIALLRQAEPLVDCERDLGLLLYFQHHLLDSLTQAGRYREAEALAPGVRALCEEIGGELDLVRLRWLEGRIDFGLGRFDSAEETFRQVQRELLPRQMGYDLALVSLDLALLLAQEGRTAALKRLAPELIPAFESREVHREAMAALLLFQAACEEERVTVDLARQLADFLRRERREPPPTRAQVEPPCLLRD